MDKRIDVLIEIKNIPADQLHIRLDNNEIADGKNRLPFCRMF